MHELVSRSTSRIPADAARMALGAAAKAARGMVRALAFGLVLFLVAPALAHAQTSTITVRAHHLNSDGSDGALLGRTSPTSSTSTTRTTRTRPTRSSGPSIAPTQSNSPIVAEGDQARPTVDLPAGRYLISFARPTTSCGASTSRCRDDAGTDRQHRPAPGPVPARQDPRVRLQRQRLDQRAPGHEERRARAASTSRSTSRPTTQVSVDYNNDPLCGGDCVTESDGSCRSTTSSPATYFISVTPPDGPCNGDAGTWVQTTTIDGGFSSAGRGRGGQRRHRRARREQLSSRPTGAPATGSGSCACRPRSPAPGHAGRSPGSAVNWRRLAAVRQAHRRPQRAGRNGRTSR